MENRLVSKYSSREWWRALGLSMACGIGAIAVWFVVVLAVRGLPQAMNGVVKQGIWLLPAAIALLSPVMILAGPRRSNSVDRGS